MPLLMLYVNYLRNWILNFTEKVRRLNCLGILVNTENVTISVPLDKLKEIDGICMLWCHKSHCNKRQLQSLLGSLLDVSKCVPTPRFFLNRLLDGLRPMEDKQQVPLALQAKRDVNWFTKFFPGSMG